MQLLKFFDKVSKRGDSGEADRWITAIHRVVQIGELTHSVNLD